MQPINPNNELKNGHIFAVGMSGCGKTSAVKKLFIKGADHVAFFDPVGDYHGKVAGGVVRGYSTLKSFASALITARKTKRGFKVAYQPKHETTVKDFDAFCRVIWAVGNGKHKKPLKVICEEVAEHSENAGKATGYHGKLLRLGRKFHIHTINLFQRGQEVSKTIVDNCQFACVMMQKTKASAIYLERMTGIPSKDIAPLEPLEYILQDGKQFKTGIIKW